MQQWGWGVLQTLEASTQATLAVVLLAPCWLGVLQ